MAQFKQEGKRYHPPSDDFAETRDKLKWSEMRLEEALKENERLKDTLKEKDELIADILDDTGRT